MPETIGNIGRALAMEPGAARSLYARACSAAKSGQAPRARTSLSPYADSGSSLFGLRGSIAVLRVEGPMMFAAGMIEMMMGAVPDEMLVAALRAAADDPQVSATLLSLHTPGGSIAGNADIVAALAYHKAAGKPIYAIANDECCSKGMILAGMADEFVVTRSAMVGHVGTIWMDYDDSEMFAAMGVKPVPAASASDKAVGRGGVPMSESVLANRQAWIDENFSLLVGAVSMRGIPDATIRGWNAGVFAAEAAVSAGLAARVVEDPDAYLTEIVARHTSGSFTPASSGRRATGTNTTPGRNSAMTPNELREKHAEAVATLEAAAVDRYKAANPTPKAPEPPKPATFAELSAAFAAKPAGRDFIFEAQAGGMSMSAAQAAWAEKVEADNARLRDEIAKSKPAPGASAPVPNFTKSSEAAPTGEPATFSEAVALVMRRDKSKRPVAINKARIEHPALHASWAAAGYPAIEA